MHYVITPERLLSWCDAAPALHVELRSVLRRTSRAPAARRVAALESAGTRLAQTICPTESADVFGALAVVLIASELIRDGAAPDAELERLVTTALHAERPLAAIFEDSTREEVAESVGRAMDQLISGARLSESQYGCVLRVQSFATFYELEAIARFEPMFSSELQPWSASTDGRALIGGVAVVKAAANFLPVPTANQGATLVKALRAPARFADEERVNHFLEVLLAGKSFDELAWHVARTQHGALIEAFARIAPAHAGRRLATELALVAGGVFNSTSRGEA